MNEEQAEAAKEQGRDLGKALIGFLLVFFLVAAPFFAMASPQAGFVSLLAALITALMFGGGEG